jgi:hypothetical protein
MLSTVTEHQINSGNKRFKELNVPLHAKLGKRRSLHRIVSEFTIGRKSDLIYALVGIILFRMQNEDRYHAGISRVFSRMNIEYNWDSCAPFSIGNWESIQLLPHIIAPCIQFCKDCYFKNTSQSVSLVRKLLMAMKIRMIFIYEIAFLKQQKIQLSVTLLGVINRHFRVISCQIYSFWQTHFKLMYFYNH